MLYPFATSLWLLAVMMIVVFAVLSVVLSPEQFREDAPKAGASLHDRFNHSSEILTNSLNASLSEFLGEGPTTV